MSWVESIARRLKLESNMRTRVHADANTSIPQRGHQRGRPLCFDSLQKERFTVHESSEPVSVGLSNSAKKWSIPKFAA
jgi:hypothetical protein